MSLEAHQRNWYRGTVEYKVQTDPEPLGIRPDLSQFLADRIESAFMAGIEAGKRIAAERLKDCIGTDVP